MVNTLTIKTEIKNISNFVIITFSTLKSKREKLSYEQAMQFTGRLKDAGKTPQETTELLVKEAIDKGSLDNVTGVVVYLSNPR
jgi:serine/threonine protein phosphatase PrpC